MFNGDVLSDVDLSALARSARSQTAAWATIFLTPVDDPRRYGLVELRADGSVESFLEKPGEWEGTALINAGVYVLEHEVLGTIPRGRLFSNRARRLPAPRPGGLAVRLCGSRLLARHRHSRKLSAGALRYSRPVGQHHGRRRVGRAYLYVAPSAEVDAGARVVPPYYIADGVRVAAGARGRTTCRARRRHRARRRGLSARIRRAGGCLDGRPRPIARSVVVRWSSIGAGTQLNGAVLGEDCAVGAGNRLGAAFACTPRRRSPTTPSSAWTDARPGGDDDPRQIFKAYDIRGLYPQELDEDAAERIGCALAQQWARARSARDGPAAVVRRPARGVRRRRRRRRRRYRRLRSRADRDGLLRRGRHAGSTAAP